ncbi:MAG: hypothetical protein GF308_18265 [Candidatus Heimdallarchaeota archaeon]|nr:hypothetical protein [Candidatus Heimdallarchaeota archaeon]
MTIGEGDIIGKIPKEKANINTEESEKTGQSKSFGKSWWAEKWLTIIEFFELDDRLAQGRTYARKGQIKALTVQKGGIIAKVQGTKFKPYTVKIELKTFSEKEWEQIITKLSSQTAIVCKLLSCIITKKIEEIVKTNNLSLFPQIDNDLKAACSCPDWANPCKHTAAVFYQVADLLDDDPFLLFRLRGKTKRELFEIIYQTRDLLAKAHSLKESKKKNELISEKSAVQQKINPYIKSPDQLESFWQMKEDKMTSIPDFREPKSNDLLISKLHSVPFTLWEKNIGKLLVKAFNTASELAKKKKRN